MRRWPLFPQATSGRTQGRAASAAAARADVGGQAMTGRGRWGDKPTLMLAAAALTAAALWVYVFCTVLLPPATPATAAGTGEGYVWTVARYQLAYLQFERQLLLYTTGRDARADELVHRHANLRAAFAILTPPAVPAASGAGLPQYDDAMRQLRAMMSRLDAGMASLPHDPYAAEDMLRTAQQYWFPLHGLLNNVRLLETQQRDRAFQDVLHKRDRLLRASAVVVLLCGGALAHLMLVLHRRRRAIERQRAALLAERRDAVQGRATIQARNTLLAMVSHELRLPLHAIAGAVDVLLSHRHGAADRLAISRIRGAAQDLLQLVDDLTDYALLEAGKLELRIAEFDIAALLRELVEDAGRQAAGRPVAIACTQDMETHRMVSDPRRVRQIVGNLLANALCHTDAGTVTVSLRRGGSPDMPAVEIAVSDTGPGIDPADHDKLFEPFTRLDASSTRVHAGLGMGLSIVRTLTWALGGQVTVNSAPGHGTTFRLTLPSA